MKRKTPGIILPQQFIGTKTFLPFLVITKTRELKLITALFILLMNAMMSTAQTNLSVTQISTSTDFSRPSHTRWNNQTGGQAVSGMPAEQLFYRRYTWADVEGNTQGAWRFNERVRPDVVAAIQQNAMFSMGIMVLYPDDSNSHNNNNVISGNQCTYPTYVHTAMQTSGVSDFLTNGYWVPNYNHATFLDRYEALHINLRNWFDTASYTYTSGTRNGQTVYFRDVLAIFDIRGVGTFGEMHHGDLGHPYDSIGYWDGHQPNRFPTVATFKRLIDMQVDAFDDYPCTFIMNILDNLRFKNTMIPSEVGHYALTKTNNVGLLGFRRDQWGDPGTYYKDISLNSTYTYGTFEFDTSTQNRYKYAPITGEPINNIGAISNCSNIVQEFTDYHAYGVGNGNYTSGTPSGSCATNILEAFRKQGSRVTITSGTMTTTLTQNTAFNITTNFQNIGLAPEYWNWITTYELRHQTNDTLAWSSTIAFTPKLFLPSGSPTAYNNNFTLPGTVGAGTYKLLIKITDPSEYRMPYPLGIEGRDTTTGAYVLRENITVQAGGNQSPTANAGNDQSIQLPTSSTSLTGSGSDADGTIASYAWTKISGGSATIVSPTSATTNITGLAQGTYTFRLTVTDNLGATGTDDVVVTVAAASGSPVYLTWETPIDSDYEQFNSSKGIRKLSSSPWSTNSGIVTAMQSMEPGDELFAQLYLSTNSWAIGLSVSKPLTYVYDDPTGNSAAVFGYVVAMDADKLQSYQAGAGVGTQKSMSNFEWVKIVYTTGQQILYQTATASTGPWTTLYTSSVTPSGAYHITFHGIGNGAGPNEIYIVKASNQSPTANAGTDKSIQLPTSSVSITGSGSDADGTIASYAWTKISGGSATIVSPSSATTNITGLAQGSYTFRLTVTDNLGATGSDDVAVTVAPANVAPTANAGTDKSITLPTSSTSFAGSGTDSDGTIASYAWTIISGGSATIASPSSATTDITGLAQGSYTFRLTVTDNQGLTGTDDVNVTVAASSNPVYLTWVTPIDSDYEQFNSNKGIRKLSSSSWSTSSGTVKAIQTMDPGDELIAQLYLASNSWAIGLTTSSSISYVYDDPTGNSNCPFGYVVAIDGSNMQAYQAGAGVGSQRSMTNFYWVKIAYSASNQNIVYSTASSSTGTWTTLYTSGTVPSGSYNIFFQGIGNGAGPNEIYINKGTVARPGPGKPTVVAPSLEPAGVNLVPNPVSSTLKININSAVPVGKSTVRIYSQNGQLVYKEQFVRSQQKITKEVDVSKYTGGIYYVYVNEGEKKGVILRFLKN